MSSGDIGIILMCTAPVQFLGQVAIYPRIVARVGLVRARVCLLSVRSGDAPTRAQMRTYRGATLWLTLVASAIPFGSLLGRNARSAPTFG